MRRSVALPVRIRLIHSRLFLALRISGRHRTLANLADANSAMYLRSRALNDPDQDVRAKCCKALRHHRDIANVRALTDCRSSTTNQSGATAWF